VFNINLNISSVLGEVITRNKQLCKHQESETSTEINRKTFTSRRHCCCCYR